MYKTPTYVILDVKDIGYEIKISLNTFLLIKHATECKLFIHEHIREDAYLLYGFSNLEEKKCFLLLNNVPALGVNTAITILSSLTLEELQTAILKEDINILKKIKGIGVKTAQRIILELKEKIDQVQVGQPSTPKQTTAISVLKHEALQALVKLGIPKNIAEQSINSVLEKHQYALSLEDLIKLALNG